ncbi:MAG: AAA family ATPase [Desulfuromonadales bacterium]|nr:AAA family ATPase [Desulfuromonadales bacterium]
MGYTEYFNFEREPFSNAPNDKFYFDCEQHRRALQRLKYSVDTDKGLAVLVGGIGTGKTTLARRMLDNLPVERYESSLLVIIHSDITPEWLLSRICVQLGVDNPASGQITMLKQLFDRLIRIEEEGRKAVVLIDEAQMLQTRELMEEFRGLLNLELPRKKLLNIIFFGLPALDEVMQLDEPLAQRVAFKYTLTPFDPRETAAYMAFRLEVSGCGQSPFLPETLPLIQSYSGGVPRLINTICDNALFETYLRHGKVVTEGIITSVVEDLGLKMLTPLKTTELFDRTPENDDLEIVFDGLNNI